MQEPTPATSEVSSRPKFMQQYPQPVTDFPPCAARRQFGLKNNEITKYAEAYKITVSQPTSPEVRTAVNKLPPPHRDAVSMNQSHPSHLAPPRATGGPQPVPRQAPDHVRVLSTPARPCATVASRRAALSLSGVPPASARPTLRFRTNNKSSYRGRPSQSTGHPQTCE
jgi:hypothetical protein